MAASQHDGENFTPRTNLELALDAVVAELRKHPVTAVTAKGIELLDGERSRVQDSTSRDEKHDTGPRVSHTSQQDVLYVRPPQIRKTLWTELGDRVIESEKNPCPATDNVNVLGERWISLRLDGSGFSKLTRLLRAKGVFPRGYSPDFAELMVACARDLLERVGGKCAYTQSDEMTVLIPPRRVDEKTGLHFPHEHNGRVQKLASQSAAFVASRFNWRLMHLFARKKLADGRAHLRSTNGTATASNQDHAAANTNADGEEVEIMPLECLATFDCRVGSYESLEHAMAVLLWRSYDCGVNGVSDKVHHLKGDEEALPTQDQREERTEVAGRDVGTKLEWLAKRGLLPLPEHQACGTFLCVARRSKVCRNLKTGTEETKLVRKVEHVGGSVIVNFLEGRLFPLDDDVEAEAAAAEVGSSVGDE